MTKRNYTYMSRLPANYYYWIEVLGNEKDMKAFLERGNERQVKSLKSVLKCLKKQNKEKYLALNGKKLEEKVNNVYTKFEK